ncbi:MAG: hypothetical protein SF187_18915 [Deltaproteobacteria bacterium]|nr:hypothetical protein [Deltaproteobacteria bacterium]
MRGVQFAVLPRSVSALTLFWAPLPLLLTLAACPQSKTTNEPKACCEQPTIPANVPAFKVVADDITGPSDGQDVKIKAVLNQAPERESLYLVLQTLYAWSLTRAPFEPIVFRAEVYASEAAASASKDTLAYIERPRGKTGPDCENSVPWTFKQSVERAFAASLNRLPQENTLDTCRIDKPKVVDRIDKDFSHQPKLNVDVDAKTAEVNYPYLLEGKDEYDPALTFNKAMTYWIEFTTSMFRRAPDLKAFKFVGIHKDAPVVSIKVDRNTFENSLASLQEEIASHAAVTFQKLGMNATSDKEADREQNTFRSKTYHDALKLLPANAVSIAKTLK